MGLSTFYKYAKLFDNAPNRKRVMENRKQNRRPPRPMNSRTVADLPRRQDKKVKGIIRYIHKKIKKKGGGFPPTAEKKNKLKY